MHWEIVAAVTILFITAILLHCECYQIQQSITVTTVKQLSKEEYNQIKTEWLRNSTLGGIDLETIKNTTCGNDKLLQMFPPNNVHIQESDAFQRLCPIQSQCDIPSIRDQYSTVGKTRFINIEFIIERGTIPTIISEKITSLLLVEMNTLYNPLGFQFNGSLIEWGPLIDDNGKIVGNWYVSLPCEVNPDFTQPCIDHVNLANMIFQNRGGFKKENTLVVLVAQIQTQIGRSSQFKGFAYFPWMPYNGLMVLVSEVLQPGVTTIQHEAGHSLGLFHIHRGTYEILYTNECPIPIPVCYEGVASDTTGDYCSDTGPFPSSNLVKLEECRVPTVQELPDFCNSSRQSWAPDGIHNIMGYMPNYCRKVFSQQQARRMRCYYDRYGFPSDNIIVGKNLGRVNALSDIILLLLSVLLFLL